MKNQQFSSTTFCSQEQYKSVQRRLLATIAALVLLFTLAALPRTARAQVVTTLAGSGAAAFLDGTGTAAALNRPVSMWLDGAGNLFVADRNNHRIRQIVIATGVVTTLAGSGAAGFMDATGTAAQFSQPYGICGDGAGNLFVADLNNHRIRRIVIATGVVTTVAGSGAAGFMDATGAAAQFNRPAMICTDGSGNLYVADNFNDRVRRIVIATGVVTTLAGSGVQGFVNATGIAAQFDRPVGICSDGAGNLFVTEENNHCVRRIVIATGVVTTLAGSGAPGFVNATGTAAQFNVPVGICSDGAGNLFLADRSNHRIRRIVIATGVVTTVAGSGVLGFLDALAAAAQFNNPAGIISDAGGILYIGDEPNNRIRRIAPQPSATYTGTTFTEDTPNNGSITVTQDITLTNDTWLPAGAFMGGGTHFTATGVPAGLTIAINRISPTVARISFTGNATAHAAMNSATVNLTFANAALTGGNAAVVTGLTPAALAVTFTNPIALYSGVTFPESPANNGTIVQTQSVSLSGDSWLPAGAFINPTHFTATGVPPGLTLSITRVNGIQADITFTGTAAAHAAANSATVVLTFQNAALANGSAMAVTGLNTSLQVVFDNTPPPGPPAPPPPPPLTAPTLSGGTFSGTVGVPLTGSLGITGNPTPTLSVISGSLPSGISFNATGLTGSPSEAGTFTASIRATNSQGTVSANVTITVAPPVPQITSISPATGTFGSTVTITGFNLGTVTGISVGGVPVQSFSVVGNSIVAVLGAPGNGSGVSISTSLGTAVSGGFTYEQPSAPVIDLSGGSGGSGSSGGGSSSGGAPTVLIPNIPTGDSNAGFFLPGQNIPIYANISITPISANGTATSFATPLQITGVSSTGASLLIPAFALLPGVQRLTVQVGTFTVSTTFAIVRAPAPTITGLSVRSTTASGEGFATIVSGTGFFRNGYARIFVNDIESLLGSAVLSSTQAQVHIPAEVNLRRGTASIRIQNFDGQSTSASVEIIGRNAPLILSATPKWTNGNLSFIVRGVAFSPRLTAVLGRRNVQVINASDVEFEVLVPGDFNTGGSPTILLFITNPDGQRYGFLIANELFQAPGTAVIGNSTKGAESSTEAAFSEVSDETGVETTSLLRAYPNPATETVSVEVPQSLKARRYSVVNTLGEEVLHGTVQGDEALTLDVRRLVKGLYTVRVVGASRVRAAQVIVR